MFLKINSFSWIISPTHYTFFKNTVLIVTQSIIIGIRIILFTLTHSWALRVILFGGVAGRWHQILKGILIKPWATQGGKPVEWSLLEITSRKGQLKTLRMFLPRRVNWDSPDICLQTCEELPKGKGRELLLCCSRRLNEESGKRLDEGVWSQLYLQWFLLPAEDGLGSIGERHAAIVGSAQAEAGRPPGAGICRQDSSIEWEAEIITSNQRFLPTGRFGVAF